MAKHFIRLYHNLEFDEIKAHTLEYGALSGICSKCKEIGIKLDENGWADAAELMRRMRIDRDHLNKIVEEHKIQQSDLTDDATTKELGKILPAFDFRGLIAVDVYPGQRRIEFFYLPDSFIMGCIVSLLTLLLAIFTLLKR